ncbi:DUF2690 domain-containing protein [Catellatospora coxensis]|uniref:DUF2690 domain-containing protein n=1 Tax=Catellatospora coxensis TaxID=310354 RepID=A0A8J3KW24_9ACTN|nr:DUF2690 domain-containing protein [Catellatospora coxensis]GIG09668.1 hypothetical protein Cco03nite_63680 [Catellatospora coxensis]
MSDRTSQARRLLATLVLAVAFVTGGVVASPGRALAACTGMGCNNKNPATESCDAAATTTTTPNSDVWYNQPSVGVWGVHVRRSTACNARWARITLDPWCAGNHPPCFDVDIRIRIERRWFDGEYVTTHVYYKTIASHTARGNYYTNMVGDSTLDQFRACYETRSVGATTWTNLSCGSWVS